MLNTYYLPVLLRDEMVASTLRCPYDVYSKAVGSRTYTSSAVNIPLELFIRYVKGVA